MPRSLASFYRNYHVKTIIFLFLTMALFVQNNVHTVLVGSWDLQSRYTVLFGHKLPTSREAKTANPQKASWQTTSGLSRLSSCIRWWKSLPVYGSFMLLMYSAQLPVGQGYLPTMTDSQ